MFLNVLAPFPGTCSCAKGGPRRCEFSRSYKTVTGWYAQPQADHEDCSGRHWSIWSLEKQNIKGLKKKDNKIQHSWEKGLWFPALTWVSQNRRSISADNTENSSLSFKVPARGDVPHRSPEQAEHSDKQLPGVRSHREFSGRRQKKLEVIKQRMHSL